MDASIDKITEKLLNEGVEKGKEEANRIVSEAKVQSDKLLTDAKAKAESIIADAKKQAADLKKTAESEIKLSGRQALSAIKQQIIDIVTAKVLDDNVSAATLSADNLKDFIKTFLQNWKADNPDSADLEVLLPAAEKEKLESSFNSAFLSELGGNVSIDFSQDIKGGFQIGPQGGAYKISLSDEDFNVFIKHYLRPRTRKFLFDE